ncbi:hypothetical protein HN011_001343 [Eciton burchellii]|nr:hypothetical protein HN011_001343 [Eciton burchellii]
MCAHALVVWTNAVPKKSTTVKKKSTLLVDQLLLALQRAAQKDVIRSKGIDRSASVLSTRSRLGPEDDQMVGTFIPMLFHLGKKSLRSNRGRSRGSWKGVGRSGQNLEEDVHQICIKGHATTRSDQGPNLLALLLQPGRVFQEEVIMTLPPSVLLIPGD